ncbi:MAG: DinB family protein [Terriglobia bacterium]|nr:MAG: DinB family protein [Terriglobia bacterium]
MKYFTMIALAAILGASALQAQNPLSTELKQDYNAVKTDLTKAADRVSDADYNFKPEGEPRTFGQLIGHTADVQLALCGAAKGEQKRGEAGAKTSKADLMAALKESFDYCDGIYNDLTDASGAQMIKMFGRDRTRFGALSFNVQHDNEMYGSIAVYMRLKNMVPPSTADRPAPGGGKKKQ